LFAKKERKKERIIIIMTKTIVFTIDNGEA